MDCIQLGCPILNTNLEFNERDEQVLKERRKSGTESDVKDYLDLRAEYRGDGFSCLAVTIRHLAVGNLKFVIIMACFVWRVLNLSDNSENFQLAHRKR